MLELHKELEALDILEKKHLQGASQKNTLDINGNPPQDSYDDVKLRAPKLKQNRGSSKRKKGYPMMYGTDGASQVNRQQESDRPFFLTTDWDANQSYIPSEGFVPMFYMPTYPGGPVCRLDFQEDSSRG
ncbi:hypothetical protein IFM89_038089 [Coptis chinensis]|uniref:Uncharacterized protein n=1 Tax=Coptis chinensis TaxID=261450 RepID=A0A835H7T2_9MAGN|nr:hypothetical protein IFM89_038089 [Coptis chinensis]